MMLVSGAGFMCNCKKNYVKIFTLKIITFTEPRLEERFEYCIQCSSGVGKQWLSMARQCLQHHHYLFLQINRAIYGNDICVYSMVNLYFVLYVLYVCEF